MPGMDEKIAIYTAAIAAQQAIEVVKKIEVANPEGEEGSTKMVAVGKYKHFASWNGEPDFYVDEYSNGDGVIGFTIRAYEGGKVKIIDYGNGGFDTDGWVKVN